MRRGRSPDVIVVGGGIVGTSLAAFLAEAGRAVLLVEAETIGAGASGRNSGAVQDPFDPELDALHARTIELYRELSERQSGFALGAGPAGLLIVSPQAEAPRATFDGVRARRPDLRPELLSPSEARALVPGLADGLHACLLATGYPVPPAAATAAFARRAGASGVRLELGRAARLDWDPPGCRVAGVVVGGERIRAETTVVAAGPWTPELVDPGGAWRPIRAAWGVNVEIGLARPPRPVLEEAGVEGVALAGTAPAASGPDVPSIFSLVTAAGSSSLGSTFLADRPDPVRLAPVLRERGARFLPGLAASPILSVRSCARPQSIDGRPLLGPLPGMDGLVVIAGHGPWGISVGPACSELVARWMVGEDVTLPPALAADRFSRARGAPA